MKTLFTSLALFFSAAIAFPQSAILDAQFLRAHMDCSEGSCDINFDKVTSPKLEKLNLELKATPDDEQVDIALKVDQEEQRLRNSILSVLKDYDIIEDASSIESHDVELALKSNPFFDGFISAQGETKAQKELISLTEARLVTEKAKNLDVTNLALGLTDFLIERTKTELNTAFFKRLKDQLENQTELRILFPNTIALLEVIGVEIYQYDLYLNNLRTAFEKDLKGLIHSVPALIESDEFEEAIDKLNKDWAYPSLVLSVDMIRNIHNGRNPGEILRLLGTSEQIDALAEVSEKGFKYSANALRTVTLMSESFRNSEGSKEYWVSESEFEKLKDPVVLRLYLGLLYEESKKEPYKHIQFPKSDGTPEITFTEVLKQIGVEWNEHYSDIHAFVTGTTTRIIDIQTAIKSFQQTKNDVKTDELTPNERNKLVFDAYYEVFTSLLNLAKHGSRLQELHDQINFPEDWHTLIEFIEYGGEMSAQIVNKQYAGAVSNAALLLNKALAENSSMNESIAKLLKYGSFMAALVEAESPEQAKAAIEAVALPPGSYTIKRESRFNVALNGYLGGFYGHEFIDGANDELVFNNLSLTAPVGVSVSWGNIFRRWKNPWSLGLSIPVVDLGTIASYRFSSGDDELESVPTIQLKDIIAPGAFLEFGIGGTPLTFGVGAQIGERLRKIEEGAEENSVGNMYWRVGASLKVDIPIFNLYVSPSKTEGILSPEIQDKRTIKELRKQKKRLEKKEQRRASYQESKSTRNKKKIENLRNEIDVLKK